MQCAHCSCSSKTMRTTYEIADWWLFSPRMETINNSIKKCEKLLFIIGMRRHWRNKSLLFTHIICDYHLSAFTVNCARAGCMRCGILFVYQQVCVPQITARIGTSEVKMEKTRLSVAYYNIYAFHFSRIRKPDERTRTHDQSIWGEEDFRSWLSLWVYLHAIWT